MQQLRFFSAANVTLNDVYFKRETTRKINQLEVRLNAAGNIVLKIPFITSLQQAEVSFAKDLSFGELSDKIKATDPKINSIFYFDVEGNCLSAAETIDKWSTFPIIMEVNSKYAYAVNFNTSLMDDTKVKNELDALTHEAHILDICKSVGLTENDQLVLANYIAKMHAGLQASEPNAIPISEVQRIFEQLNYAYSTTTHDNEQKLKSFEELQRQLDDKLDRLTHFMSIQK